MSQQTLLHFPRKMSRHVAAHAIGSLVVLINTTQDTDLDLIDLDLQ